MAKFRKLWNAKRRKPPVPIETAVLATIWWLANKSTYRCEYNILELVNSFNKSHNIFAILATGDRFNMDRGTNHRVVLRFCKLLYNKRATYIKWPRREELQNVSAQFRRFPNVIGAVDGTHIQIPRPKKDDSYNNRKLTASIQVQLVCDGKKTIIDVFCGYPGSAHDARVWKDSPLYKLLSSEQTGIPVQNHLLGDSAYPLDVFLMRPYKNVGHLTQKQIKFNTIHSSSRMVIENAIGLLKGKFRRLKYMEITNLRNAKFYIIAAVCLHNYIISENTVDIIHANTDVMSCNEDDSMSSSESPQEEEEEDDDERSPRINEAKLKRDEIADMLFS